MGARERTRTGGRSARIQEAVHRAVETLQTEVQRSELSVPMIAARAGVTPSTIYRRWGGLPELLGDVALRHLRPIADPVDAGSFRADLRLWTEQFADEMSSEVGRSVLRDVITDPASGVGASQCYVFISDQIVAIRERALDRGEAVPEMDHVMDQLVAPILFRILFARDRLNVDADYCRDLVDRLDARGAPTETAVASKLKHAS